MKRERYMYAMYKVVDLIRITEPDMITSIDSSLN